MSKDKNKNEKYKQKIKLSKIKTKYKVPHHTHWNKIRDLQLHNTKECRSLKYIMEMHLCCGEVRPFLVKGN